MKANGPGLDRRRLQLLLAVLFVALAAPTGAVIWQAYSRLKWEAFHQYRSQAEELHGEDAQAGPAVPGPGSRLVRTQELLGAERAVAAYFGDQFAHRWS